MDQKPEIDPQKAIILIDGSSFLYRSYYGVRPMHTSKGVPVQAVFNFCRMIRKLIDDFKPAYVVIAWDSKGPTERHALFADYKATRQEAPSDLFAQKQKIVEFSDLIGIKQIAVPGVEADDIMYSLARDAVDAGDNVIMVTSDKDMGQIVGDHVIVFDWFKNEFLDTKAFEIKFGFPVSKLPFYYALIGDSSDNIPGVTGIGKVGATELVQQFNSLEDLYDHIDQVKKERMRNALLEHKEDAFLSEKLFLLRYHKLGLKTQDFAFDASKWPQAKPLFEELEFKSLLADLSKTGTEVVQVPLLSVAKGYKFITVTKSAELELIINEIQEKKAFACDTEGDSLDPLQCNLMGISICVQSGTAYYIPVGHHTIEEQMPINDVLEKLKPVFEDASIKKYLQHTKYDELVLSQYGIYVRNVAFDTMIAAHLVTKDWQSVGLKNLSKYYLQEEMLTFADVVKNKGYKSFAQVPLDLATEYAAADAHQTLRLVPLLQLELHQQNMEKLYYDIELPLASVLFKMEKEGIYLDVNVLKRLDVQVSKDLELIEQKINALVGHKYTKLNLNSPKQIEALLFQDLQLPVQKKTRTGYSTDQEVLEALAKIHPVPELIIRHRELSKLKNTYIDALPEYINRKDNKIHTSFSQTSVATGRLSSSDPNLQNIPVHTKPYDVHVRSAFKPEQGHVFISADYSQIELRVLAFLSQDKNLKAAFEAGRDVHSETASKLFDVPLDAVTSDQRRLAKQINFSILYGLTPYGLSKELGISFSDAKYYIQKYFEQYPQISQWMEGVIEETKQHGYVTTHWGRRRYLPGIYEQNRTLYDLARRMAINTKAQGTAAELMKLGMIQLDKVLSIHLPQTHILLQIHDELLVSVPQQHQEAAQNLIKKTLEQVVTWDVPLVVDVRVGNDWQETTK